MYIHLEAHHLANACQQPDAFSGAYAKESVFYSSKSVRDFPLTSLGSRASPREMSLYQTHMKQCHMQCLYSAELRACPLGSGRKSRNDVD